MRYRLSDAAFYRKYGEYTLLFQTKTKGVFVLNAVSKDILDCFKNWNDSEGCLKELRKSFDIKNEDEKPVIEFIERMASSNILEEEKILSEKKDGADLWFQNDLLPKGQLFAAMFELTFRCNEKCKHCYCVKDKKKKELSTEEIKKVITELQKMNAFELTFTGGDMFVRKDAFDILKYAKSLGFLINIFTNGIALTDSDFLILKSLNPKSIHFSLYSDKSEEHDNFTGLEGSFLKTTDAIKKCVMLGLPTNIKTCVMDFNKGAIGGILTLAKELGATAQVSMSLSAKNDGDTKNTSLRLKKVEDYANVMKTVNENIEIHCSNDYRILRSSSGAICGAGIRSININPYGDVFPCNSLLIKCGNSAKNQYVIYGRTQMSYPK